jgi:hypothetical protein
VLSVDDLAFSHKGSTLFLGYLSRRESLSAKAPSAGVDVLGIGGIA